MINTQEFIDRVNEETAYKVMVYPYRDYMIEIINDEGILFLTIDIPKDKVVFHNSLSIIMNDDSKRPLLDLLSEYSVTLDKDIPSSSNGNKLITTEEYEELKEKELKLKELESVLTGRSEVYTMPF